MSLFQVILEPTDELKQRDPIRMATFLCLDFVFWIGRFLFKLEENLPQFVYVSSPASLKDQNSVSLKNTRCGTEKIKILSLPASAYTVA